MWKLSSVALAAVCLAGCVVERPVPVYAPVYRSESAPPRPRPVYSPPPEAAAPMVISVVVEPPISQPPAIAVPWAPPPMLVEVPPPPPPAAVWVGGYWVWQGTWVWAHGYWATPPQPSYHWVQPYYEHRDGAVIFVAAHWAAPGVVFVPPPLGIHIELAAVRADVVPGPRPIGPPGVFVPPPPGSRVGLIVPAPIGTPPAVVVSAPPVVNVGMRVQAHVDSHNTTVINNITNVTNITHVTVVAPPSATANGQAVQATVPAQAHLAAALPPVVKSLAPPPVSRQAVPTWTPGHPLPTLPATAAVTGHGPVADATASHGVAIPAAAMPERQPSAPLASVPHPPPVMPPHPPSAQAGLPPPPPPREARALAEPHEAPEWREPSGSRDKHEAREVPRESHEAHDVHPHPPVQAAHPASAAAKEDRRAEREHEGEREHSREAHDPREPHPVRPTERE